MPDAPENTDLATEDRILEAAHEVFVTRGVAAARTQEIADAAGVNKALLHYYYRTKEKLADAVFLRVAVTLFPRLMGALGSDLPLRDKLRATIETQSKALAAAPFLPGYVLCEMRSNSDRLSKLLSEAVPLEEMRTTVFGKLQTQLDEEHAAGRLRPTSAQELVVALISMVLFPHAGAHMLEAAVGLDDAARQRLSAWRRAELADFLLRGFAPDAP